MTRLDSLAGLALRKPAPDVARRYRDACPALGLAFLMWGVVALVWNFGRWVL
jgi:hypothetical protein